MDSLEISAADEAFVEEFGEIFEEGYVSPDEEAEEVEGEAEEEFEFSEEDVAEESEEESEESPEEGEEGEEAPVETVDPEGLFEVVIGEEKSHVSVKDLSEAYLDGKARQTQWDVFHAERQKFNEEQVASIATLEWAKTEAEILLADSGKVDLDSLSGDEYKAEAIRRQALAAKIESLKGEVDRRVNLKAEMEREATQRKAQAANEYLQRNIAGYNNQMYQEALVHSVNVLGADKDTVLALLDPVIVQLLIEKHRADTTSIKTEAVKMPKKVVKTKGKVVKDKSGLIDGFDAVWQDLV